MVVGACSNREDVVFGTVLSGRLQGTEGASRTVGLFLNTLPIRLSLEGTAEAALLKTHKELLALLEHEQAPLPLVRDCTALASEASLFTCLLNCRRNDSGVDVGLEGEDTLLLESGMESDSPDDIEELDEGYERTNYPLILNVDESSTGDILSLIHI